MSLQKPLTKAEIAKLPRWAVVAFAARCARRVLPLFQADWPMASIGDVAAVIRAVEYAEQAAVTAHYAAAHGGEDVAADVATAKAAATANTAAVAEAAAEAAEAAAAAAEDAAAADADEDAENAAAAANAADEDAAANAAAAAVAAIAVVGAAAAAAIARDFHILRERAGSERWSNSTPVPPDVFGPLWPEGVPKGWPVDVSENDDIVLEIEMPPGTAQAVAVGFVNALLDRADDLHRALGGHGLKIETVEVHGDDRGLGRKKVAS